jgi:hypothetical protein
VWSFISIFLVHLMAWCYSQTSLPPWLSWGGGRSTDSPSGCI